MARRREQYGPLNYFPYMDAAEQATVSEEGAFSITNAADIGRPQRGRRSFESPTLPARARPAVAALSRAAPPPPRPRAAPTPSGTAPRAGATGFGAPAPRQQRPQQGFGSVGDPYAFAKQPTYAPSLSGGAAGAAPGGYKPPGQVQAVVPKPVAKARRR